MDLMKQKFDDNQCDGNQKKYEREQTNFKKKMKS